MPIISIPPPNVPLVDNGGIINTDWYRSLVSLVKPITQGLSVSTAGIVVCTDPATGSAVTRSLAAGTGLAISNADGTAGNPSYSLANTAVSASTYGDSTHVGAFTVDAQGRLTAASSVAIAFPVSSVFGRTGAVTAATNDYSFAQISGTAAIAQLPSVPAFSAYLSSPQSISASTFTKVTLDTEEFDTTSNFASSRFTASIAGYYQFNGTIRANGATVTGLTISFYKNGSELVRPFAATSLLGGAGSISAVIALSINDYVELWGAVDGTTTTFDFGNTAATCRMSGHWVGP